MATTFFPSLSYGECAMEDILQLFEDGYEDLELLLPDHLNAESEAILPTHIQNHATVKTQPTHSYLDESTPPTLDGTYTPYAISNNRNTEQSFPYHNIFLEIASIQNQPGEDSSGCSQTWSHPATDASVCVCVNNSGPSALMSSLEYPILNATLRDELVEIYFCNVHPLCPIIDEQNFCHYYNVLDVRDFFTMFPAMLFNAMMFTAFAHATSEQVRLSGFSGTIEAQTYYVQALTKMYEYARCEARSLSEELALAKVALLLSLWCPSKLQLMANSRWIDRAIFHTKKSMQSGLSDPDTLMPKRCNILHWCCIARNTFISFAMRRPYRLFIEDQPLCDPEDVRSEFDREVLSHNFSSPKAKLRMVDDFVTLCKLTQRLNSILKSQQSALFELHWNSDPTTTEERDEACNGQELHKHLSRYLEAANFESELLDLINTQEKISHERSPTNAVNMINSENSSEDMLAKLRQYFLHIITYSSITALYQFTLSTTSKLWARSCHRTALLKLRDASTEVALTIQDLLAETSVEAIPGGILAWIIPPMTTFIVQRNCEKYSLLQFSDDDNPNDNRNGALPRSPRMGHILALANVLAPRFQAAQDIVSLIQDLDQLLSHGTTVRCDGTRLQVSSSKAPIVEKNLQSSSLGQEEDMRAADLVLLKHASSFLDARIAYGLTT